MDLNKDVCESTFQLHYQAKITGLGAVRSTLLQVLRSVDRKGWLTRRESGRLDRKAFVRVATGSTAVFKQRKNVEAVRSAVSVLIDCSGSMVNGAIELAQVVAIQLSDILDRSGVAFNVTGFNGDSSNVYGQATGSDKTFLAATEAVNLIAFKAWNEPLRRVTAKMGSIHRWANSSTPDYSAISLSIDAIAMRPEQRKILFILTDSEGYCKAHMQYLQSVADRLGVIIVAIGIGSDDAKKVFNNAETVHQIDDLASASFNTLLKTLRR